MPRVAKLSLMDKMLEEPDDLPGKDEFRRVDGIQEITPSFASELNLIRRLARKPGKKVHILYDVLRAPGLCYEMRLLSLSDSAISKIFGVDLDTFKKWLNDYPRFRQAYNQGGEGADGKVAKSLFKRALGWEHEATKIVFDKDTKEFHEHKYTERYAPDTQAAIHWLSSRQGKYWAPKSTHVHTDGDGNPLAAPNIIIQPVIALTEDQLPRRQKTIDHKPDESS